MLTNKDNIRSFKLALIVPLLIFFTNVCVAATSLSLHAPHGHQDTSIIVELQIVSTSDIAGFNAEINFPVGITITNVTSGSLLTTSGNFSLAEQINGQNLRALAYSSTDTITGSGEILKVSIQLNGISTGLKQLSFSAVNPNPLIKSNHAVSNFDGSVSLVHSYSDDTFLVFSDTSDFDNDTLPDYWEVQFGLDPMADNADSDSDGDGYSDAEEFAAGTDPANPNSTPNPVIFKDGFEG